MGINLWDPRTKILHKNIKSRGSVAKSVYNYYIEDLDRDPIKILPTGTSYNFETKKYYPNLEPKPNKNIQVIHYQQIVGGWESYLYHLLKAYAGKTIEMTLRWSVYGGGEKDRIEVVPKTNLSSWWSGLYYWFIVNSDEPIFGSENDDWDSDSQATLIISSKDNVSAQQIQQSFLDGISHCVFTPIGEWVDDNFNNQQEGTEMYGRWRAKKNWLIKRNDKSLGIKGGFMNHYSQGVPDNEKDLQ